MLGRAADSARRAVGAAAERRGATATDGAATTWAAARRRSRATRTRRPSCSISTSLRSWRPAILRQSRRPPKDRSRRRSGAAAGFVCGFFIVALLRLAPCTRPFGCDRPAGPIARRARQMKARRRRGWRKRSTKRNEYPAARFRANKRQSARPRFRRPAPTRACRGTPRRRTARRCRRRSATLIPRPSRKAEGGQTPSLTIRPRGSAVEDAARAGAFRRARCRAATTSPSASPSAAASSGCISAVGRRFARARGRRLGEARVEEVARRRGRELERMLVVGRLVDRPVVGQGRHVAPRPLEAVVGEGRGRPIRAQAEVAVGIGEAVEEMRLLERRLAIEPRCSPRARRASRGPRRASVQSMISRGLMAKPGWRGAEPLGERADDFVVGAAASRRLDRLGAELQILVAAAGVEVVVLEEHRRRQHDVGERARCR